MTEEEFIKAVAKKDAPTVLKVVTSILSKSFKHWAKEANEALEESKTCGFHDREADEAEKRYNYAFRQWHHSAQSIRLVKEWANSNRPVPGKSDNEPVAS